MTVRATTAILLIALGGAGAVAVTTAPADPPVDGRPATVYVPVTTIVDRRVDGLNAREWRGRAIHNRRGWNVSLRARTEIAERLTVALRNTRRRWAPTLTNAVRLASAVTGVSSSQMFSVAYCESTNNPYASNGTHWGYWQLSWFPFGLSPYDPYAAALSTAMTVREDHGWRQWRASIACHHLR